MLQINLESERMKFFSYLKNSHNILLVNHRRMDGDCFGSLSAFYYLLKANGYNVIAMNDETTPITFQFLNKQEIFQSELGDFQPDIIIGFDVAGVEQLGELYKKYHDVFLNTTCIVIDHHLSNPGFGNINIIDTEASSTCEITWELIQKLGWEKHMNSQIATFLLTGIITDTNSFFNTNSTPKALQSASEIMLFGPRHQDIIINLFKKKPYTRLKLWGKVLESLKDIQNGKIVRNIIPKSLFIQTGTTDKDISGLIDEFLTTIDGLEVGFVLYEIGENKVKGSFRARSDAIDLSVFCSKWGGGGHARASGFVVEGKNIYEVEGEVVEELKNFFVHVQY